MSLSRPLLQQARRSRLPFALILWLGFGQALLVSAQAWLLSQIITRVFLQGGGLIEVQVSLWLLGGIFVLRAAAAGGMEAAAGAVARQVKGHLRAWLAEKLLQLGPLHARAERSGELTNTLTNGVEALDAYFSQYLPQMALAALIPLTILICVFPIEPLSGLVLLLTAPLLPVFMVLIGSLSESATRKQWSTLSRLSAHFLDTLQGLTTLKELGQSRQRATDVAAAGEAYRQATLGVLRITFLSALVLELIGTLSTAVVAVEIGLRLLYGRLDYPAALFILILAPEFYLPLRTLGMRFHAGMSGTAAARRIFEILDTPLPDTVRDKPLTPVLSAGGMGLRLEGVGFTYPGSERPALQNVNMEIKPGEMVALVGPSGGGKSTLFQLLLGFAGPQTGEIFANGRPLGKWDAGAWRRQVAWVPQQPYLFQDSVAENMRIANGDAKEADLWDALRLANLENWVRSLPDGLHTQIGERGQRLSGSQAQRLALARAFLRHDAPLLLLDEPAASLDPAAEQCLQEALDILRGQRTVVVIAHRLKTVMKAGRVLVLEGGQVVETGTPADLLVQGGRYADLLRAYGGGA